MKMSVFQMVSLGLFAVLLLVGIGFFSTYNNVGRSGAVGKVTIWGTADFSVVDRALTEIRQKDKTLQDVTYVQKNSETYATDLINAMASGRGPDLFMISQDQVTGFSDKIGTIPYGAVSQQSFTESYIDEAQLFLTGEGALALPFSVDPMVMYFNRDLISSEGYANPPQYWNDFLEMAPKLTKLDSGGAISKSAVAMGGWENIAYAKDILAMLFMQAGDPIVVRGSGGVLTPTLGTVQDSQNTDNPATSALQFYTEFANPVKTTYSWNRSLPKSQDAFVAGDLAIYFGFASDYSVLKERNPNLRLGVAQMPQIQGGGVTLTFGQMTGLAIPRTTGNPTGALLAAQKLTSQQSITSFIAASNLPPVRRDVKVDTSKDAAQSVFAKSALISRGWLDPEPAKSDEVFRDMVESVMSGKAGPSVAIFNANQALQTLLKTNVIQTPR